MSSLISDGFKVEGGEVSSHTLRSALTSTLIKSASREEWRKRLSVAAELTHVWIHISYIYFKGTSCKSVILSMTRCVFWKFLKWWTERLRLRLTSSTPAACTPSQQTNSGYIKAKIMTLGHVFCGSLCCSLKLFPQTCIILILFTFVWVNFFGSKCISSFLPLTKKQTKKKIALVVFWIVPWHRTSKLSTSSTLLWTPL